MGDLVTSQNRIAPMTTEAVEKVRAIENIAKTLPQLPIHTGHVLHAGLYARTITIPAGAFLTGALIKRSTLLILSGHALVYIGSETHELAGYHVLAAGAHRKQAFLAIEDTHLTMLFASAADSIEQAEDQFTDEGHLLCSRQPENTNQITITGE